MDTSRESLLESLTRWFGALRLGLSATFASPSLDEKTVADAEWQIDPDFEGWLNNDPMVTGNPASRYRSQPPGYLTSNGRGSLEIGAAED